MQEGYEEFKLKVLHKVTSKYLEHHDLPPIICCQGEKGQNKLLVLPPQMFATKAYKEYLPQILTDLLAKTGSKYFCFIMQCTVTQIDIGDGREKLKQTAIGRQILEKFKKYNEDGVSAPHFDDLEHKLLTDTLGEDRVVFMFQAKKGKDTMMSFTLEEEGKLKPSLSFDEEKGNQMGGLFGRLFK